MVAGLFDITTTLSARLIASDISCVTSNAVLSVSYTHLKDFSFCIKYLLEQYYNNGSFISGQILMGAQQDGVGLCMETSLFKNFTVDDYEYQCSMLDEDTVSELPDEESVLHVGQLPVKSAIIVIK